MDRGRTSPPSFILKKRKEYMSCKSITILRYDDKTSILEYAGVDYGAGIQYEPPEHVYKLTSLTSSILTPSFFIDWGLAFDPAQRIAAVRESFEFVASSMMHEIYDRSPWRSLRMMAWCRDNQYRTSKAANAFRLIDVSTGLPEAIQAMEARQNLLNQISKTGLFPDIRMKTSQRLYRYAMSLSAEAEKTRESRQALLKSLTQKARRIPLIHGRDAIERKIIEKYGIKTTMRVGFFLFAPLACFDEKQKARVRTVAGRKGHFLLDLYDPKISERYIGYPVCPMLPRSAK